MGDAVKEILFSRSLFYKKVRILYTRISFFSIFMQRLAKNHIILITTVLLVILFFLGGFFFIRNAPKSKGGISPLEVTNAYASDLQDLRNSLSESTLSDTFPGPFMSNFLQVVVPYQYKENHLNAFFDLQKLAQAQESGQEVQVLHIQEILDSLINLKKI